jgi:hypothetical protein
MEVSPLLEWHRWLGTMGTGAALAAALATGGVHRRSPAGVRIYRIALFAAGMLVVVTGHVGGLLVWDANFLHATNHLLFNRHRVWRPLSC